MLEAVQGRGHHVVRDDARVASLLNEVGQPPRARIRSTSSAGNVERSATSARSVQPGREIPQRLDTVIVDESIDELVINDAPICATSSATCVAVRVGVP